jgi:hypothetical protein
MLDNLLYLLAALVLVACNGFFVAIEFALIKMRPSRLTQLKSLRAPTAVEKDVCWPRSRIRIRFSGCCGRSGFLAKCRSWRPRVHRLVVSRVGLARDAVR